MSAPAAVRAAPAAPAATGPEAAAGVIAAATAAPASAAAVVSGREAAVAGAGVVGILLAAGRGSRFDPAGTRNKLLQALPGNDGEPVAAASARALLAAVPRVIAVVRPEDAATANLLRGLGCEVIACNAAGSGMATSLVCGVRHAQEAQGWLIALADMPYVQPSTMAALAAAVGEGAAGQGAAVKGPAAGQDATKPSAADIAAPVHEGQRGNPVAFGRAHLPALLALQGDQGARSILKNNPVNELAVNDPGILQDIDTPSDIK